MTITAEILLELKIGCDRWRACFAERYPFGVTPTAEDVWWCMDRGPMRIIYVDRIMSAFGVVSLGYFQFLERSERIRARLARSRVRSDDFEEDLAHLCRLAAAALAELPEPDFCPLPANH